MTAKAAVTKRAFDGDTAELQTLCVSITDCHHSTPNWTDEGRVVIRSENIKNGKVSLNDTSFTDEATFQKRISRSIPDPGDLIITREAPMGEIGMIPDGVTCCLGQRLVLVKPDAAKLDKHYLLYAMQSEFVQKQIGASDDTGSTVSNLRIPLLKELAIPLLGDKAAQKKIAEVLSALDAKIDLNNRISAELEALAKTIYDYWFVQFDFPDANGRPYKTSGGKMVWNNTLKREIPAEWESGLLGDIVSLERGVTYSKEDVRSLADVQSSGVLRATNVSGNKIDLNDLVRIDSHKIASKQKIFTLETLIVMSSGSKEHVGKNGVYYFDEAVAFGAFCSKIVPDAKRRWFVSTFLRSGWFKSYINNQCLGTNINNLRNEHIRDCLIVKPDDAASSRFEATVDSFYKRIANNTVECRTLEQLRDWLLPLLMNGQVKVA